MRRTARNSLLFLLTSLLIINFSLSVLAAEEEVVEEPAVTSTTVDSGLAPAVEVESEATEPPLADWTYRYMVPTGLLLAGVIILMTAIRYFTNVVRKRYRIVE